MIEGYGPGFFRIGGQVIHGACLITPWDAGPWGGVADLAAPLALAGKGGKARASSLTAERRAEIAKKAASMRWAKD